MRTAWTILIVLCFAANVLASEGSSRSALNAAVRGVDCTDSSVVERSTAQLREAGPEGLRALLERYDRDPVPRLEPIIDTIAGQHDAVFSRLYWYTDLDKAKAAAREQHKPILYLRLLGKLTDEYSCANSRYFRTVLYANMSVSQLLRDHFVLVWVSERPVPVVTIDYGDGRVMKRTITGNSAHYVLSSEGRVVDVLPGLFDPVAFARIISSAAVFTHPDYAEAVLEHIGREHSMLLRAWESEAGGQGRPGVAAARVGAPDAAEAAGRAISKSSGENPLLRALSPELRQELTRQIDRADLVAWDRIAALHLNDAHLDAGSLALMRRQAGDADSAFFHRTVDRFQHLLAADTVRNNYQLRRQALEWITAARTLIDVEDFNRRVYAELFLTPRSDPWLGLGGDAYLALETSNCRTVDAATPAAGK